MFCSERPLHSPPGHAAPKHDANQFVRGLMFRHVLGRSRDLHPQVCVTVYKAGKETEGWTVCKQGNETRRGRGAGGSQCEALGHGL